MRLFGNKRNIDRITLCPTSGYTRFYSADSEQDACGGGIFCELSAVLSFCVLSGNWSPYGGGGVYGGTLSNCTLRGNGAFSLWGWGVGRALYNCTLTDNFLDYGFGGGVYEGTLYNCMLTGNRAEWGGGTHSCVLNNCTLAGNSAVYEGSGAL